MASLDRAYGHRGALIALGMAVVAGSVQGVLAHEFDNLAAKIALGVANAIVLIMAGAISARRSLAAALGIAVAMAMCVFTARWGGWALMVDGFPGLAAFLGTPPWGWPGYLADRGISPFWTVEAGSMLIPSLIGCYAGYERGATIPDRAAAEEG